MIVKAEFIKEFREFVSGLGGNHLTLNDSQKSYIKRAFELITGKKFVKTCSNCYRDAIIQIEVIIRKIEKGDFMEKRFLVKRGVLVRTPNVNISYGNETDELSIKALAYNKKLIAKFERYPNDWENIVSDYVRQNKATVEDEKEGEGKEIEGEKKVSEIEGEKKVSEIEGEKKVSEIEGKEGKKKDEVNEGNGKKEVKRTVTKRSSRRVSAKVQNKATVEDKK